MPKATPNMNEYGLIGKTLGHSFSPAYFAQKFESEGIAARYTAFELPAITDFPALVAAQPNLRGLNVTVPYKKAILPYLDALDGPAKAMGAVNCILFAGGKKQGYNTDWLGFWESLKAAFNPLPAGALVLGTGGAAAAVAYALTQGGLPFKVVSRKPAGGQLSYAQVNTQTLAQFPLIVNTTPLGTAPQVAACPPIPYHLLQPQNALFDLVYNPIQTLFLARGAAQGCATQNGAAMLRIQAAESWRIWNRFGGQGSVTGDQIFLP